ncbi:MAG: hypothetical protein JKY12_00575 [Sneathiella sp.]|nr:hypothetical protein [Sneathiella sp.]
MFTVTKLRSFFHRVTAVAPAPEISIIRANIAADRRAAMEKRKQKMQGELSSPEKQGVFYRFRQMVS